MHPPPTPAFLGRQQDLDALLQDSLHQLLGPLEPDALATLREQLHWVEVPGGEALMRQGEPGDALYISVSGRLRAYIDEGSGSPPRLVREMARGQVIGELSLFTDEPRSASVVAVRDSVLVRLDKPAFQRLLASSPQASMALTRQIISRLQNAQPAVRPASPVVMGLLAISAGVDAAALAAGLAQAMSALRVGAAVQGAPAVAAAVQDGRAARVRVIDATAVDAALQQPGIARRPLDDSDASRRIALWLDHQEAQSDFVLLVADDAPTPWTARCSRHADELLLLADATQPPALHATETDLLLPRRHWPLPGPAPAATGPTEILLLQHPAATTMPRGTAAWLARRPVSEHLHLRSGHAGDLARLARLQAGQGVGLVLAGGGARGLAHLGVWRALRERGIEVDLIGGTSIGSVMGALIAADLPLDRAMALARQAFGSEPTRDFNLVPVLSLIKGQRLKRVIAQAVHDMMGGPADLADLWKPFFCIAANYTHAHEMVVQRGPMAKLLRASLSIPGALPPVVHDGELLCDGGTFNNFPVDVMQRRRGVGRVIGVDLSVHKPRRYDFDDVPGPWALLRDRLRPYAQRRYRLPGMAAFLMNVTILYSHSRQRQARALTDLHFNPPLARVGMLQWKRLEQIVQQGYEHALQVLDAPPPA